jgi:hypothetical protein
VLDSPPGDRSNAATDSRRSPELVSPFLRILPEQDLLECDTARLHDVKEDEWRFDRHCRLAGSVTQQMLAPRGPSSRPPAS